MIGTLLFIGFIVLIAVQVHSEAPNLPNCRVCGEPSTIEICGACDRQTGERLRTGRHVRVSHLVRAVEARMAAHEDSVVVVRR